MIDKTEYKSFYLGDLVKNSMATLAATDTEQPLTSYSTVSAVDVTTSSIITTGSAHGLVSGDKIFISGMGSTGTLGAFLNDQFYTATKLTNTTFIILDSNGDKLDLTSYTWTADAGFIVKSYPVKSVLLFGKSDNGGLIGWGSNGSVTANKPASFSVSVKIRDLATVKIIGTSGDKLYYDTVEEF